jgi:ferredoxin
MTQMQQLYAHLCRYTHAQWIDTVELLSANIHPIDRDATRIWFAFYPLNLHLALEAASDKAALQRRLVLMGKWGLADSIDSSHRFLYAHRFWPQVKSAIAGTDHFPDSLAALVSQVADGASRTARVDRDRLLGMAAVGLMTLRQAGADAFGAAPGTVHLSERVRARSTHQVMTARAKDDWQGPFGFLRGIRKRWTVTFDENAPDSTFVAVNNQEVASAAQSDKREYRSKDPRCIPNEGPIPVECRSASCGTCWVGILGGATKLSPVEKHEAVRMKVFGYADIREGSQPPIRLACQARAMGAVTIVIPPWNGIISRL